MDKKIKILFIKPSNQTINHAIDLPLGILSLSAFLKKKFNEDVEIEFIDFRVKKNPWDYFKDRLKNFKPDIVGISLLTFEDAFLDKCTKISKALSPQSTVLVGGPHPTINYMDILNNYDVDYAVVGEGERVLSNIIDAYLESDSINHLKGIAYRGNDNEILFNGREEYLDDLDSLPCLDYDLTNISDYWGYHTQMNFLLANLRYVPIMSSRACPYQCAYCHNIFGKKLRKRSPEHFLGEVEKLYRDYGVREFHIVDDIFNIDRERMYEILEGILRRKMDLKIAFPNALRGDLLTREDLVLLKRAGVYMVTMAIESGAERVQRLICKNLDVGKVVENIAIASELGLLTKGYFMIGFPGERIEEIHQTIDLAIGSKLDMAAFFVVTPFHGTELYEMALKEWPDILMKDRGSYYEKSCYEMATGCNLRKIQKRAYMKFYSPMRLLRLFKKTPMKYYLVHSFIKSAFSTIQI